MGEILHSISGLVRSPVLITTLQVGSRIVALHMINTSPRAQGMYIINNNNNVNE